MNPDAAYLLDRARRQAAAVLARRNRT